MTTAIHTSSSSVCSFHGEEIRYVLHAKILEVEHACKHIHPILEILLLSNRLCSQFFSHVHTLFPMESTSDNGPSSTTSSTVHCNGDVYHLHYGILMCINSISALSFPISFPLGRDYALPPPKVSQGEPHIQARPPHLENLVLPNIVFAEFFNILHTLFPMKIYVSLSPGPSLRPSIARSVFNDYFCNLGAVLHRGPHLSLPLVSCGLPYKSYGAEQVRFCKGLVANTLNAV